MKRALVCGAGGFIGHHLVSKLKAEGYWVRAVDLKFPEFSQTQADEFVILDLRDSLHCKKALLIDGGFDEVYQLAADMGGMGFIHAAECEIIRNNTLINLHMVHEAALSKVGRYFFSSSACVYRNMTSGEPFVAEELAYPAEPDNEYGWEKLYAERAAMTYSRKFGIKVRVARFQNCFGPEGTWRGGREKAPAALCRKIAEVADGGTIEVWGDGTALRSYTYVSDMVDGIYMLMQSEMEEPVNIGLDHFVSVNELVAAIAKISGKRFTVKHIDGPIGVQARNHLFEKIRSIGWEATVSLEAGLRLTYPWILEQVSAARARGEDTSAVPDMQLLTTPGH